LVHNEQEPEQNTQRQFPRFLQVVSEGYDCRDEYKGRKQQEEMNQPLQKKREEAGDRVKENTEICREKGKELFPDWTNRNLIIGDQLDDLFHGLPSPKDMPSPTKGEGDYRIIVRGLSLRRQVLDLNRRKWSRL